ncbi:MAG: hypothetical protein RIF32_07870 [Leptospirales bacterium]|jgi:hypothetical protein
MIDSSVVRQKAARGLRRFRIIEGFRSNEELVEAVYLELKVLLDPKELYQMERQELDCAIEVLSVLAAFYKCSIDCLIGHSPVAAPV